MQMDKFICLQRKTVGRLNLFLICQSVTPPLYCWRKGFLHIDAAMRRAVEANVMVGFCGSGGSPLFGASGYGLMPPQSEYRPTEYMQSWMIKWLSDNERVNIGKKLLKERANYAEMQWRKNADCKKMALLFLMRFVNHFLKMWTALTPHNSAFAAEARWPGALYSILAKAFNFTFSREEGKV